MCLDVPHDVFNEAEGVLGVPVGEVVAPSNKYVVRFIGVYHVLHALDEDCSKSVIEVQLLHEIRSYLTCIFFVPEVCHGDPAGDGVGIVHKVSQETRLLGRERARGALKNWLPLKEHRLILDALEPL